MDAVAGHIKSAITARLSPDAKHSRDDAMVANNKHGGDPKGAREDQNNDNNQVGDLDKAQLVDAEPTSCHACKVSFTSSKSKGELACMLCENWFCSACSKFKKSEITGILSRPDVMWACVSCLVLIKNNHEKIKMTSKDETNENETTNTSSDFDRRLRELEVSIETKIEDTVRAVIPKVMEQCLIPTMTKSVETSVESSVNKNVSKAWAETVTGTCSNEDFPTLDDPEFKNAPVKPKVTLRNAVKEAVIEQKKMMT